MKVILLCDVKNYGKKNDIIDVSNGYASNFLLPKGLAVLANHDNVAKISKQIAEEEKLSQEKLDAYKKIAKQIDDIQLEFNLSFNNGKPQGSVSLAHVCDLLSKSYNLNVDKRKFIKHENIKDKGLHYLKIKLANNIEATLKVNINEK